MEIIHLQAKIPTTKALRNAMLRKGTVKSPMPSVRISMKSLAAAPKITGSTIKKENLAALDRSTPSSTELPIVDPERLIPGKIAIA